MHVVRQMIPGRADLATMVKLALPVATVQVGLMFMGVVDTIMVGHYSVTDLAAVALGNMYFFTAAVFGMGTLFVLDPTVSQAYGAGDMEAAAKAIQRGFALALGLGIMAVALLLPVRAVLTVFQQPPEVIPVAAGYALVSIPGVFPFYAFIVLRQSLQAMGRVAPIFWTILVTNVANAFLNWVLIYGHLGFPEMGAVGTGWATTVSRWLMAVGLLVFAWPILRRYIWPVRQRVFEAVPILRMLKLGAPIGMHMFLEFGVFGMTALFMGWIGTIAVASHQVALNMAALTFMFSVGVTQASSVLVGQAVGAGDPGRARRSAGAGLLLAAGVMSVTAVVFLTVPETLARIYTDDPEVIALAALLIPVAGVFQVVDGLQVVATGVLRGVGDTLAPMLVGLLGFWLIGLPIGFWLGFGRDWGAVGLWWGLAAGLGAVALFLLVRVRVRFGQDLRRLTLDDEEAALSSPG